MKAFDNPVVIKCLDISTGHIKIEDMHLLQNGTCYSGEFGDDDCPVVSHKFQEGFLIFIPDEDQDKIISEYGYSNNFLNILKIGRKNYCVYILLDRDATQYEDLEFFNW
jgi:hypothetical protein